jgi:hypothetical protein
LGARIAAGGEHPASARLAVSTGMGDGLSMGPSQLVVMAEAQGRYGGLVLGRPRLEGPTITFDGRTER